MRRQARFGIGLRSARPRRRIAAAAAAAAAGSTPGAMPPKPMFVVSRAEQRCQRRTGDATPARRPLPDRACSRRSYPRRDRTADAAAESSSDPASPRCWSMRRPVRRVHRQSHALRRSQASDRDPRILRVQQAPCAMSRASTRVDAGNLRRLVRRDLQVVRFFFLQLDIDHDHRRTARRRDGFVVCALDRGQRFFQRLRLRVPLREAAHHAGHVVRACARR